MNFDNTQQLVVNTFNGKINDKQKAISHVESYYKTHDDDLTRFVKFNKDKIGTDMVFFPIPGYYLITDGIRIIGVGEMMKDPKTGKLIVPKKKYLPPKSYNTRNLKYLNQYIHGDNDNDGIPNVDDLYPNVPSDTSAEEVSLSKNLKEIEAKRRKLKVALLKFSEELSPIREEYKILIRAKTPVSIINKLHSKRFLVNDPEKSVVRDSIGGMVIVDSIDELKQIEQFIDKEFKGRILEKDDKYGQLKTTWCLESFKEGSKNVFRASEECTVCLKPCKIETDFYGGIRTYTALHYNILVQDGEDIALIAELQVKTRTAKKVSDWIHGMYKERSKKYDELFQFLFDVAEQLDNKGKGKNDLERKVLRYFYRMRGTATNVLIEDPSYYIPPQLISSYYKNGKKLPAGLKNILESHEKKVRKT